MHRSSPVSILALGLALLTAGCGSSTGSPGGETPVDSPSTAAGVQRLPDTRGDSPFYLETADVRVAESDPIQLFLEVTGDAPTPGHTVAYLVEHDGDRITVEITTEAGEGVSPQVLQPHSFSIPLGTAELPVTVDVNAGQFVLTVDA